MKVRTWTVLWVLGLVVAIGASQAMALPIVAPDGLAAIEGNFNIQHMASDGPLREQQIYDAADFGSELITILGYRLRPDGARQTAASTIDYTDVKIFLSTATTEAPLSVTYADNIGPDATLVYSGNLALSTSPTNPGVGPNAFDMTVEFDTPFSYDPSQGDLLVDFTAMAIVGAVIFDAKWIFPSQRRIIWSDPSLAVADNGSGGVFVRQFDVGPAPIPEPATLLLLGSGLAGLAGVRRKFRKK